MKKLSAILAGVVLFGGLSFAAPVLKQDAKAPVAKQTTKPAVKPAEKPVTKPAKPAGKPAVKPAPKPVTKPTNKPKGGDVPPTHHKGGPVKKAAK